MDRSIEMAAAQRERETMLNFVAYTLVDVSDLTPEQKAAALIGMNRTRAAIKESVAKTEITLIAR